MSTKLASRHELWRRGILKWKLHSTQRKLYDLLAGKRRYFLLCSRRLGKSYLLVTLAIEHAIRHPGSRISYAAPTMKDATQIATDLASQIFADCPDDIKPDFSTADKEYRFKNGSTIRFSGVDAGHHENLRGRAAHLFILDEAGTMSELRYVLDSVVAPMTLTTKGRIILASTPPRSPGHDMTKVAKDMLRKGEAAVFTLLDAPHIDDAEKFDALERAGENPERIPDILAGKAEPETTTALREFWARLDVTDSESAVVPEFTTALQKEICVAHPRPPYFDAYVSLDPGFVDASGALFGYYDFVAKKLCIEDEFLIRRASSDDIARMIRDKELALWSGKPPLIRAVDNDPRFAADMAQRHGLMFIQYQRADAQGGVDLIRSMLRRREIIINPNCTTLIRQLRNATFNRSGKDFERSQEDSHYDLLSSLRIMCRALVKDRNPYPAWYGAPGYDVMGSFSHQRPKTVFSDTPLGRKLSKKWG